MGVINYEATQSKAQEDLICGVKGLTYQAERS